MTPPKTYILHLAGAGDGKPFPAGLEGFPTANSEGQPIHYRRVKIAACREWTHRGTGEKFKITKERADEWQRNSAALAAAGIKPFIPGQHREQFNAADNFGYVERIERDGDDVFAIIGLHGDTALDIAARNGRSVYVVKDAIDSSGKVYPGESLHHLALVPNPALPDLGGTLKIAASADTPSRDVPVFELSAIPTTPAPSRRRFKMKPELAAQVRAKLGFGADVPDDQLDDKAAEKALALSVDIATITTEKNTLKSERDAKASEVLALSGDPKIDPMSMSLITRSFKTDRDAVIASGVVSEAGMKEIDALLFNEGKPTRAALALSAGSTDPFYSRICDILRRNPGIKANNSVDRRESFPATHLALSSDGTKSDEQIVKDAFEAGKKWRDDQLSARGVTA